MLSDGAFTVLLLLFSGASAALVLPPTDVTVSCQNVRVTVSWKYGNQQPQTSFRVNITSSPSGHSESYTTAEHQFDLSPFIWKSEERYMGLHYVSVSAIQGGILSEPVESKTFSFNHLKTASLIWNLNFPDVDVSVKDSGATVSFMNPLHFYRELQEANKSDEAYLSFSVSSDENTSKDCGGCTVKEKICKCDIVFPGAERCVTLNGSLFSGSTGAEVRFTGTDPKCVEEPTKFDAIMFVLALSAVVLVIIVVTILICKAKAWTMKIKDPLPKPLDHSSLQYNRVSNPESCSSVIDLITVIPKEEKTFPKRRPDSGTGSDLQLHADPYTDGHLLESSDQEGHRTDSDSADDSVKTECVSMDLEEGEERREAEGAEGSLRSHYDRGHAIEVDIGDGEMVTGYSERQLSEGSSQEGHRSDNESADDLMDLDEGEEEEEGEWEEGGLPGHYIPRNAFSVDIGDGEMVTGYSER